MAEGVILLPLFYAEALLLCHKGIRLLTIALIDLKVWCAKE